MSNDLSDILKELNSGQNPTPGQGTGGGKIGRAHV